MPALCKAHFSAGIKHVFFDKSYAQYKGHWRHEASDEGVDFLKGLGLMAEKRGGL
jgi:dCMP deaminase